jgi:RNA polymerase sigma factor (sigma-70 family)
MERAIADQLETLHPDAFGWALHCCAGDHARAEDVLQNAYLKLAQERASHDGRSSFKTWWFGVIRLTAHEEFRRQRYRESFWANCSPSSPKSTIPRRHGTWRWTSAMRSCGVASQQLPARQAEVLHLVFYQDLTINEAANVMRVGLGSARQHYERGKARLRTLLQPGSPHE